MALHLYDTLTRTTREFQPVRAGAASIYVCGPTPQGPPHIGHIRSALNYDVLRRWLAHNGLDVTLVRNVTDVDDKILAKAQAAGRPWWEWAATYSRQFEAGYDALGCLPASVLPQATGHVTQMTELMQRLIDSGHAYAAAGDVYFDVRSYGDYGALSGQRPDEVQQGETAAEGKRDHRDFTLWKGAKPGEPSWPTPWGPGRPGWHLECSAMATVYLGAEFDIHGGGLDLVFPHHENELAQSRAAGDPFCRVWMHNGLVGMAGEKMSKSLGNVVSIPAMLAKVRAAELRAYLVQPHYRTLIEYSDDALFEAAQGYRRIEQFLRRASGRIGSIELGTLPAEFTAAMDDDLATPHAFAVLHNTVREGNAALDAGDDDRTTDLASATRGMADVLGIDPPSEQWQDGSADTGARRALAALVEAVLQDRQRARAERDFATADALRDRLLQAGISVEDTPDGPTWTVKDGNA